MEFKFTEDFAQDLDQKDPLKDFRNEFLLPKVNGKTALYFTGNSLGLQAKKTQQYIQQELNDWAGLGVEGHTEANRAWLPYHEFFTPYLSKIVGAKESEVVAMNGLTANLHLMMVSFFRPSGKRTKIVCEAKAFPSDQYALRSQLRFHGLDPDEHLIEIQPEENELIPDDKVVETIKANAEEIALIMLGGVNYYTGQVFDMKRITEEGHKAGAKVGWDLAHGAGNVVLSLHDWGVDFAAWCGYKYLNSGPGGVSGVFVHEKHHGQKDIPRFEGWWGHDKDTRFAMPDTFIPMNTVEAWQLSNAPVLAMTPLLASLELFEKAGMERLRTKGLELSGYLRFVIGEVANETGHPLKILTPVEDARRGCQISMVVPQVGKKVFDALTEAGVIADWREPDVIRLAPVPLYNSFQDVYKFGKLLSKTLKSL
jgi:kynureninase